MRAAQRIHLGPDARELSSEQAQAHGYKALKQSHGPLLEPPALVRLPGPAVLPLLIAEGVETGLSVWSASGYETWIALGALGRLVLPPGRKAVICRDDDPDDSPADKALRRAAAAWSEAGVNFVVAAPRPEGRFDKTDLNDLLRSSDLEAVRSRIEAALHPGRPAPRRVPGAEARSWLAYTMDKAIAAAEQHERVIADAIRDGMPAARDEAEKRALQRPYASPLAQEQAAERVALQAARTAHSPPAFAIGSGVGVGKCDLARHTVAPKLAALRAQGDRRKVAFAIPVSIRRAPRC